MTVNTPDIAIIGAGAAGLMAAIHAARANPEAKVVAFDSARKLGAKILVAGGGRCNVTHAAVSESAYAGSSRNAIKKVLRRFDVPQTVEFFAALGVNLKQEDTGKLFPVTDDAHTVLNALLRAAGDAGVTIEHPFKVDRIHRESDGFRIDFDASTPREPVHAHRIILASGGKALSKSGSDGHGYSIATSFGHSLTTRILPALVPLTLESGHPLLALSGLAIPMTLQVHASTGKKLASFTNSTLCTHFGLSGPGPLDVSRYLQYAQIEDPGAYLALNLLPGHTHEELESELIQGGGRSIISVVKKVKSIAPAKSPDDLAEGIDLQGDFPERLVRALCEMIGLDASSPAHTLTRDNRKKLVTTFTALKVPVTGTRGFTHAEVTAGGIPLSELHLDTMESRISPGLFLCGEILDVDGRIGGYNFQWAWASGYIAGLSAAKKS